MKSALVSLALAAALLTGCGKEPAEAPAATTPAATTPAAAPTPAPVPAETPAAAPATTEPAAPAAEPAASSESAPLPATPAAPVDVPPPTGPEPVEGTDYVRIDPPAPLSQAPGKIEVAEVFAYYCIHCATMEKLVAPWKAALPADVDFKPVPMAHGNSEPFARAFYAAEAMGILPATHEQVFDLVAVQRKIGSGSAEDLAALYGGLGQDPDTVLATMKSFAVNAQVSRAQKAVTRWAIEVTPTFVVAGKYRIITPQRENIFNVVEHLVARERAAAGTGTTP